MSDDTKTPDAEELEAESAAISASPRISSDVIMESAPGFSLASLMISSSSAQSRALEASVAHLNHTYMPGLATSTQCVNRILEDRDQALDMIRSMVANNDI